MIGKKITPILEKIEGALWEFELNGGQKPEYDVNGFRAATKIFMSVFMDKVWELQEAEGITIEQRMLMVKKAGEDIRKIIRIYTNIDTHKLYEKSEV